MTGASTTHEEHESFRAELEEIERLADAIGETPDAELRPRVTAVHEFMAHTVLPHAVAEGVLVFPVLRVEAGEPTIGVRMTQCHVQLSRLTDELEQVLQRWDADTSATARDLRRILYSLHATLRGHLAEQDEQIEPLLEASLPREEREALFAAVERTAKGIADLYE
jgi:hemerythrin-like domain-containing protein